jgi:hypothetical protein
MAQEITRANVVPRQGGGANEGGVSSVRPQELQVHLYTSIKYSLHSDFVVVPTNLFGLRAIQNLCRTRKSEGSIYIWSLHNIYHGLIINTTTSIVSKHVVF